MLIVIGNQLLMAAGFTITIALLLPFFRYYFHTFEKNLNPIFNQEFPAKLGKTREE